jgi:hypothetical protein
VGKLATQYYEVLFSGFLDHIISRPSIGLGVDGSSARYISKQASQEENNLIICIEDPSGCTSMP